MFTSGHRRNLDVTVIHEQTRVPFCPVSVSMNATADHSHMEPFRILYFLEKCFCVHLCYYFCCSILSNFLAGDICTFVSDCSSLIHGRVVLEVI